VVVPAAKLDEPAVGSLEHGSAPLHDAPDAPGARWTPRATARGDERVVFPAFEREPEGGATHGRSDGQELAWKRPDERSLFDDDTDAARFGEVTNIAAEPVGNVDGRARAPGEQKPLTNERPGPLPG
jgi:hypothetical protein